MNRSVLPLALLLGACAGSAPPGNSIPAASEERRGLDARLTGYDYPYPVETYRFEAQRQTLEMAYMDIRPERDGNGEVVVLLHGKNFSGAYWANTIAPLRARGYRVLVPDQIGFGKSSKPERFQFSFQALATFTADLMTEVGVERAHVVGHSMGGMLGVRFALMFPERVRTLTLVNPIGLEDWKRVVPYRPVGWWFERERKQTAAAVRAYMTDSYFDGTWKEEYEPLLELQAGWIAGPDHERIAWVSALTYDMIFTQPVVYELGLLEVPTSLIIGGRDRTALGKPLVSPEVRATLGIYPELARQAEAAIPDASLTLLDDIGHVPQYEATEAYLQALTDFLTTPRRPAPTGTATPPPTP